MRRELSIIHKTIMIFCIATASVVAMSFKPIADARKLHVRFSNRVGDNLVVLDTVFYKNSLKQSYTVTKLKYYISNINLTDDSGHVFNEKESYHLIDIEKPESLEFDLANVPPRAYDKLSFTVGVDSLHNCSGAQSGALDPVNAMFWTWNTGYIFFKLEGRSPASKSPGGIFEYHIGGYREPSNCIRTVTLNLKLEYPLSNHTELSTINIRADVAKLMDGKTAIDIAKLSSVTDFRNAPAIADNYAHMFWISRLEYDY